LLSRHVEIGETYRDESHRLKNELTDAEARLTRHQMQYEEAQKRSDVIEEQLNRIIAEHSIEVLMSVVEENSFNIHA
jgi:hypothetical protein